MMVAAELKAGDKPVPSSTTVENTPARLILVSIPDRRLVLLEGGKVVKTYRTATGARATPSPTGSFTIANRVVKPTYYHSGKAIPPGDANPLGTRWIGLSVKGYGIHGTNVPASIGRAASHGCIRMRNRDVEELFELVRTGDPVEFRPESITELLQTLGTSLAAAPKSVPGPIASKPAGTN
jgi:lipoprotein-anchoring transpeptidase ErfK/SrfK